VTCTCIKPKTICHSTWGCLRKLCWAGMDTGGGPEAPPLFFCDVKCKIVHSGTLSATKLAPAKMEIKLAKAESIFKTTKAAASTVITSL